MPGENIVDLEGLLRPYLGPNKKIIDVKKERLTAPGENYCSLMLKLDITLENLETGKEEVLHAVAKTINTEVNEFFKKAAPPQFKKEIAFYTEIVPTLQEFQREQGITEVIDLFPKLYAARKNLHGTDDEVDDDCVIILENLKVQGYANIDRAIGFDLEGAILVLKDLAVFHALPIALKQKQPEVFERKLRKNCFSPIPKNAAMGSFGKPEWLDFIENHAECKKYFKTILELFDSVDSSPYAITKRPSDGPFVSIFHCDMWSNNTMQLFDNGRPLKNKLVDFQLYRYSSLICDLVFFIWSSIQYVVVKNHYEELLKIYHDTFLNTLNQFELDTTVYSYSNFLEQIYEDAPYEFFHTLFMAGPMKGRKGESAIDLKEEDFSKMVEAVIFSQEAKEHIANVVLEFGQRGWIRKLEKLY